MIDIIESIRELKELLGYEYDYEWNEVEPPVKKEPEIIDEKDKAIVKVLESIENYLQEEICKNNGFYD
jgi:hypothetical protein